MNERVIAPNPQPLPIREGRKRSGDIAFQGKRDGRLSRAVKPAGSPLLLPVFPAQCP